MGELLTADGEVARCAVALLAVFTLTQPVLDAENHGCPINSSDIVSFHCVCGCAIAAWAVAAEVPPQPRH